MEFEFAKYTEITDLAFEHGTGYKGYVRFFICPDVHDTWFCRILENTNSEYDTEEGSFLLERNNIPNEYKGQELTVDRVVDIIQEDDGSNWDYQQAYSVDELIDMLDDGFGILNLKK